MNRSELSSAFQKVRQTTRDLCRPLCTEDYVIQSMPDVSPPKWHLGHTTWFFERMILEEFADNYRACHPRYYFVFNSYYQSFGERVARDIRGTLSRPTVEEVFAYRTEVDEKLVGLIGGLEQGRFAEFADLVELGLHHEQQHQELLVTDVKHILASNPLRPTYRTCDGDGIRRAPAPSPPTFHEFEAGMFEMGAPDGGFAWDNERPRHKTWLSDYGLMDRPVTCGEYLDFMKDGGYREPLLWLSDGWDAVSENGWRSPLYWDRRDGDWEIVTLRGSRPLDLAEPVATSASMKRTPMPVGRIGACRPRRNGKGPPGSMDVRCRGTFWKTAASIRLPGDAGPGRDSRGCANCSGTSGNGREAPTCPIPGTARTGVRSASTTENS